MRIGYIIDVLTSVEIQEIVKIGGQVVENFEEVTYRENIILSLFREVIDKLLALRQKYKDENYNVMQFLVKLLTNSLYSEQIRKDKKGNSPCKSE